MPFYLINIVEYIVVFLGLKACFHAVEMRKSLCRETKRRVPIIRLEFRRCTVCSVQCTVYSVQYTMYSVQCTVYSVQCTVNRVQCTEFSVQCTVNSVQCTA